MDKNNLKLLKKIKKKEIIRKNRSFNDYRQIARCERKPPEIFVNNKKQVYFPI
jgi:hypothetical protein